ncbi:MAG: NUDIX domain-containing protein [Oscillospiraceae bacterium]|jgi:8-oxo-dGTP pyrophosphatase MutT (NUDIX family)|nr:NUDIX domain-containing protein [Oscillospiraceae bacterium]
MSKEIWDVRDSFGNATGRYATRGTAFPPDGYHLVVHVWKYNSHGEWLIDKRAPRATDRVQGMWETTGGSAQSGEDSIKAALRESKEELGLRLAKDKGEHFKRYNAPMEGGGTCIHDVWVFKCDCSETGLKLDSSEVAEAKWADAETIRQLILNGEFWDVEYECFEKMIEMYTPLSAF